MHSIEAGGVIVVDKPEGWTSHDVVGRMRRLAGTRRIGHLGTLDPIATGVLPLVVGRATRLAQFFTRNDKVYEAVIRLGWSTDSYDRSGVPTSPESAPSLDRDALDRLLDAWRGRYSQVPPPVSAKKVGGVPAYKLARKNVAVELAPVDVEMYELALSGFDGTELRVRAHCSAGTYMRSIAHELGIAAGCGAHLQDLRRTASGDFQIEHARTIEQLQALAAEGRIAEALVPSARLLPDLPTHYADDTAAARIRQGRDFPVSPFRQHPNSRYVKAVTREGELIAIGELKLANVCHPVVVL
ncbi:MAG: tRNA pseudouridine(55) synthase TruB [Bryobacteraceae bacterium]